MTRPKTKVEIVHNDILGRPLAVGDFVAASYHNNMRVSKITKLAPKMVILSLPLSSYRDNFKCYPNQCVLLPIDDVTFYLLSK